MRRLRNLAPFLVLLSALVASQLTSATSATKDDGSSIDKMALANFKELKNYSALVDNDNDDDLSMDPSPQISQIIRGNPFRSSSTSKHLQPFFVNF